MPTYTLYGLLVRSDESISGLRQVDDLLRPDLEVHFKTGSEPLPAHIGRVRLYGGVDDAPHGIFVDRLEPSNDLILEYPDGMRFHVSRRRKSVTVSRPAEYSVADAAIYLIGGAFSVILRAWGRDTLHASSVVAENRLIAFLGVSGAGKSTIAAAFVRQGHRVMADDLLVLGSGIESDRVHPGPARLALLPEAVDRLFGSLHGFPPVGHGWDKYRYDLEPGGLLCEQSMSLDTIYVLQKRSSDGITRFSGLDAAKALLALATSPLISRFDDPETRERTFEVARRLLERRVTVRALSVGDDWRAVRNLPEAVANDLRSQSAYQSTAAV